MHFELFWGTQQTIPREKPDYMVDLHKSIKTERLLLALEVLIGLVRFRTFLTMKTYSKSPFCHLNMDLNFNFVSKLNLPITSHQ